MMTDVSARAALIGGIALLERAVNYTFGSLDLIRPRMLSRPTPCRAWDLRALLTHMIDSIDAVREAVELAEIDLRGSVGETDPRVDLVATVRRGARELLGAWTSAAGRGRLPTTDGGSISIARRPISGGVVTATGAIELAVHGWDVASACGRSRPIPVSLAEELLELAPLLVTGADRGGRFATPVGIPTGAAAGDRLIAFLGRDPDPVRP
jgi:uncharacterized protein (TIGR03086 family)